MSEYFSNSSFYSQINYQNDYIVGSLFIITSVCSLVIYIPILIIIYESKQLQSPCYTFMISLGISDVISLIGWVLIGIHTVTHGHVVPKHMITVILCFLVVGWGSLTTHLAMIAFNRYISVCHSNRQNRLFSKNKMVLLLTVSWIYAIFLHASATFVPPHMFYSLDGYFASWESADITEFYIIEDITCCSTVFLFCLFCYTAVIIKYASVRRQINPEGVLTAKERRDGLRQFKIAFQTALRCIIFLVYDLLYYLVPTYSTNVWAVFICSTYLWCFNNAMNPWVYLIFNEQLRNIVKRRLFKIKEIDTLTTYNGTVAINLRSVAKIAIISKALTKR